MDARLTGVPVADRIGGVIGIVGGLPPAETRRHRLVGALLAIGLDRGAHRAVHPATAELDHPLRRATALEESS